MISSSKAYVFECGNATYAECLQNKVFGSSSPWPLQVKQGDYCCLYNSDLEKLYGLWCAICDGKKDINPDALDGRRPFQVLVELAGSEISDMGAKVTETHLNPSTGQLENVLQVGQSSCTLGL